MEIRWLLAFITVAEELHFGRAAGRLHMAQSPLSQTIKKLERDMGVPLFERNTRSVHLTSAGRAFLPYAREVIRRLEAARQATQAAEAEVAGPLRLGYSGMLNHSVLPQLTRSVQEEFPEVDVQLIGRLTDAEVVEQLSRGTLDLACARLPMDSTKVNSRLISAEHFGAVLPRDHRLAESETIDLADLSEGSFILTPTTSAMDLHQAALRLCANAGFRPHIIQEVTDSYVILLLVAAGVGVTIMTEGVAELVPPGAVFIPLQDRDLKLMHGIAWSIDEGSIVRDAVLELSEKILPSPGAL